MLLAIDTATRQVSLALHDGQHLIAEHTWKSENHHTTQVAPAIQTMMATCDVTMDQLTVLAAANGPGSYTGLRIGVALAKGIAAVRNLPLVGVNALDVLAAGQSFYQSGVGLIAVVQAGRGRITVKTYRWRKGQWNSRSDPKLMTWEDLLANLDGSALITGEINQAGFEALHEAQAQQVPITIAPAAQRVRRAGYMAELAWAQLNTSEDPAAAFAPAKLTPIYIKSDIS